jgi:hypothetical protein
MQDVFNPLRMRAALFGGRLAEMPRKAFVAVVEQTFRDAVVQVSCVVLVLVSLQEGRLHVGIEGEW